MDKIYLKDNYVVTELGGITAVFPKNYSSYSENASGFYINSTFPVNNQRTVYIDFTRVTSVYNEAGTVAYSIATLRSFLLLNTGFKSPSGGSGGSTITVGTTPVTSGTDGRVFFQSGGVVQQDSSFFWDNTNKRLGVGTSSPGAFTLDVNGSSRIQTNLNIGGTSTNGNITATDGSYTLNYASTTGNGRLRLSGLYPTLEITNAANQLRARIENNGPSGTFRLYNNGVANVYLNGTNNASDNFIQGSISIGSATSPQARLDVRAQGALSTDLILRTRNSADTRNFLVVNGAGDVYNNGAGGVTSNTFYGENVGRSATGGSNTFIGSLAGRNVTTGTNNTILGSDAARNSTTGTNNTYIGSSAGINNNGGNNTFVGQGVGTSALTTQSNDFYGVFSGQSTTGSYNSLFGSQTLRHQTTGNYNCALGHQAGRFISGGTNLTIANNSVFIGFDTRANADNETNQIVIGHNAIGTGSNSVTLGNTSITRTNLRGQVVISGFASAPTGVEGAIYYDSTTKKHYGFDGTNWNALY